MTVPVCTPCRGSGGGVRWSGLAWVPVVVFGGLVWHGFRFRFPGLVWRSIRWYYGVFTPVTKPLQPVLGGSPSQTEPGGDSYHQKEFFTTN